MTSHILCAVDLSHDLDARALVSEAGRLADLEGASLSLVAVLPDYGTSFVGSFFADGTLKQAAEAARVALHKLVQDVLPAHRNVQCIVEIV